MGEIQSDRLDLALRKNKGRKILSDWLADLSDACGTVVGPQDLLGIEQTEVLKRQFFARVGAGKDQSRREWSRDRFGEVTSLLKDLSIDVRATPVILFSSVDRYVGAVCLPASAVLMHAEAVWRVVGEDLAIGTPDLDDGLCLEFNYYNEKGEYVKEGIYEITAWGMFIPRNAGLW